MRKFVALALFAAALVGLSGPAWSAADDKKDPEIKVPYVPTNMSVVEAMLKLAAVKEGETVYDLGCGDGRIVITAVGQFKAKKGLGVDFNPERLKQGDVLKMTEEDFKDVDVVTLYLLPEVNRRLKPILQKGLKPGARVVSHDFDMGEDWKEDKKEEVKSERAYPHTIYLWTIKKK